MTGAVIITIILVVVIPVSVGMGGAIIAAVLGWSLKEHAEDAHEGSDLVDLDG